MKALINLVTAIFLTLPVISFSQWSSDPMQNTPVDISSEDQTLPKIAIDPETGNVFIAYFSFESGNYNLMLQYFDHQGYRIWPEPFVVSNNLQDLMLTDYSALIDHDGNCVLAFSDIRNGTPDIFANKVSPGGEQLWGEQGIRLSHHPEAEYSPVLCITEDNNAIVSWNEKNGDEGDILVMAAIDQNGDFLWYNGKIKWFPDGDYSYAKPELLSTNDGDFIVVFRRESGLVTDITRYVYAQRLNISGEPVWPAEAHINDAGGLTAWDEISIKPDDDGGFYVAWDDDRDINAVRESFIQHVDASGNLLFMANGLLVSTQFSQRRYPLVAGWNDNNEVYVYWKQARIEKAGEDEEDALFGQRISQDGIRMWTDNGKTVIPADSGLNVILGCDIRNNLSYLFLKINGTDVTDQRIRAKCVDKEGISAWETDQLSVSEATKEITHTFMSHYFSGQWIIAWSDVRDTNIRDLYAQNINEDGSIGNTTGIVDQNQQEIDIYPNPCNGTLNIRQNGYQQLSLVNLAGQAVMEMKINESVKSIDVGDMKPGIYFIKLYGQKGISVLKVVIVGH